MTGSKKLAVGALLAGALLAPPAALGAPVTYAVQLSGPAEAPPNTSPGTGSATIVIDTTAHSLSLDTSFSGLLGATTAAHIHCCTAVPFSGAIGVATPVPTFPGFPLGVSGGSYFRVLDTSVLSSWNLAFVNANGGTPLGAEAAVAQGLASGRAYLNIHSTIFPGGEIRGFATPVAVPEPSSMALLGAGLLGFGLVRRRARRIA